MRKEVAKHDKVYIGIMLHVREIETDMCEEQVDMIQIVLRCCTSKRVKRNLLCYNGSFAIHSNPAGTSDTGDTNQFV